MALEALKAEIGLLLESMGDARHDQYETHIQLKERLNALRVFGMRAPDDLLRLETALDERFSAKHKKQLQRNAHNIRHRHPGSAGH